MTHWRKGSGAASNRRKELPSWRKLCSANTIVSPRRVKAPAREYIPIGRPRIKNAQVPMSTALLPPVLNQTAAKIRIRDSDLHLRTLKIGGRTLKIGGRTQPSPTPPPKRVRRLTTPPHDTSAFSAMCVIQKPSKVGGINAWNATTTICATSVLRTTHSINLTFVVIR